MSEFTTDIKTKYTNVKRESSQKGFTSIYEKKNYNNIISGKNKQDNKRYASRLIK